MTAHPPADGRTVGPQLDVTGVVVASLPNRGQWQVSWTVRNRESGPIQVHEAWLPHGRFRSPRRSYDPPIAITAGSETAVSFPVNCDEEPGAVVENAFVILNVIWRDEPWRIFIRLRAEIGPGGAPTPTTESTSAQRVQFAC